jgi:ribosomal protein S14
MKWRILLELTETTGRVQTREMVTGDRPTNVISPESIGLSLAESKSILAAMQTQLVQAQTDGYCDHRRKCSHCGSRHGVIEWRTMLCGLVFWRGGFLTSGRLLQRDQAIGYYINAWLRFARLVKISGYFQFVFDSQRVAFRKLL